MRVKDHNRIRRIREFVESRGYTSVDQLRQEFDVSPATIRRDILDLENDGHVSRIYGGVYPRTISQIPNYTARHSLRHEAKVAIARIAAEQLTEGDTIYLDPGTTIEQLAIHLASNVKTMRLAVVTASALVAMHLAECENINLIVLGGQLNRITKSYTGHLPEKAVENLIINKYFMATIGVVPGYGLTESSNEDCTLKRAVLKRANTVYLLADSQKFNSQGVYLAAPLSSISQVITDSEISPEALAYLREQGLEPILAQV